MKQKQHPSKGWDFKLIYKNSLKCTKYSKHPKAATDLNFIRHTCPKKPRVEEEWQALLHIYGF